MLPDGKATGTEEKEFFPLLVFSPVKRGGEHRVKTTPKKAIKKLCTIFGRGDEPSSPPNVKEGRVQSGEKYWGCNNGGGGYGGGGGGGTYKNGQAWAKNPQTLRKIYTFFCEDDIHVYDGSKGMRKRKRNITIFFSFPHVWFWRG